MSQSSQSSVGATGTGLASVTSPNAIRSLLTALASTGTGIPPSVQPAMQLAASSSLSATSSLLSVRDEALIEVIRGSRSGPAHLIGVFAARGAGKSRLLDEICRSFAADSVVSRDPKWNAERKRFQTTLPVPITFTGVQSVDTKRVGLAASTSVEDKLRLSLVLRILHSVYFNGMMNWNTFLDRVQKNWTQSLQHLKLSDVLQEIRTDSGKPHILLLVDDMTEVGGGSDSGDAKAKAAARAETVQELKSVLNKAVASDDKLDVVMSVRSWMDLAEPVPSNPDEAVHKTSSVRRFLYLKTIEWKDAIPMLTETMKTHSIPSRHLSLIEHLLSFAGGHPQSIQFVMDSIVQHKSDLQNSALESAKLHSLLLRSTQDRFVSYEEMSWKAVTTALGSGGTWVLGLEGLYCDSTLEEDVGPTAEELTCRRGVYITSVHRFWTEDVTKPETNLLLLDRWARSVLARSGSDQSREEHALEREAAEIITRLTEYSDDRLKQPLLSRKMYLTDRLKQCVRWVPTAVNKHYECGGIDPDWYEPDAPPPPTGVEAEEEARHGFFVSPKHWGFEKSREIRTRVRIPTVLAECIDVTGPLVSLPPLPQIQDIFATPKMQFLKPTDLNKSDQFDYCIRTALPLPLSVFVTTKLSAPSASEHPTDISAQELMQTIHECQKSLSAREQYGMWTHMHACMQIACSVRDFYSR